MMVPPMMLPLLKAVRPPLLKMPALPISRIPLLALLVKMPVRLMLAPVPAPVNTSRVSVPRLAAVVLPSRFRIVPPERFSAPVLARLVPLSVSVPALALMMPVLPLLQDVGTTLMAPALRLKVPLLTNELVAMVVVWPATFCRMVPLLTRPPVLLWLKLV